MKATEHAASVATVTMVAATNEKRPPIPQELWEKARAMRIAGASWPVIARDVQLNEGSLRARWAREKGAKLCRAIDAARISIPQKRLSDTEATIEDISRRVRDLLAADSLATSLRVAQYDPQDIREEGMRESVMGSLVKRSAQVLGWESASSTVQVQVGVIASLPDRPQVDE